jgi:hypothetical protein
MPSTLPHTGPLSPPHKSHNDKEPTILGPPIILSTKATTPITADVAQANAATQKMVAPSADDYTPPGSESPEPKATTSAMTILPCSSRNLGGTLQVMQQNNGPHYQSSRGVVPLVFCSVQYTFDFWFYYS